MIYDLWMGQSPEDRADEIKRACGVTDEEEWEDDNWADGDDGWG